MKLDGYALWLPEIGGWFSWGPVMGAIIKENFPPGCPGPEAPYPGAVLERSLDATLISATPEGIQ